MPAIIDAPVQNLRLTKFPRKVSSVIAGLLFFLLCFTPKHAAADDQSIIVQIKLNQVNKGDYFVIKKGDGDFLIRTNDLKDIGFVSPGGVEVEASGEQYRSLRSMADVSFTFDEKTLTLLVEASPELLPLKTFDMKAGIGRDVYYPNDQSAFLNYSLTYTDGTGYDSPTTELANELAVRRDDYLFLTDTLYRNDESGSEFHRLLSSLFYEQRSSMSRAVAGDILTPPGDIAGSVYLGGIGYSRDYSIDPYFIEYPSYDLTGHAFLPSEVEVYVNGHLTLRERVSPGRYELQNLPLQGGANDIEIVLRDAMGRERRIQRPFYFSDTLLRRGLHEFSYNIGALRENLGTDDDRYTGLAFSAFHRYGINDRLTVGYRLEGASGVVNLGAEGSTLAGDYGVVKLVLSASTDDDSGDSGYAGLARYSFLTRHFNFRLSLSGYSRDYVRYDQGEPISIKSFSIANASYNFGTAGSVSLAYSVTSRYAGEDTNVITTAYSRPLSRKTNLFVRLSRSEGDETEDRVFLGLTHRFGTDVNLSSDYLKDSGIELARVRYEKEIPVGEGYGYRAIVEREKTDYATTSRVMPSVQYNLRHALLRVDYTGSIPESGDPYSEYSLTAAGSLVYIDNRFGITRPVQDSFGLVKVGNIEGVKVSVNSEEIGLTDKSGTVLVPRLASYLRNHIMIDSNNIPMEYSIDQLDRYVSPPLRSGSTIAFEPVKFQAFTGMLKLRKDGASLPVEYNEAIMSVGQRQVIIYTGKGGELYFENVGSGTYPVTVQFRKNLYSFELTVPASEDMIVDLGEVLIDSPPSDAEHPL